MARSEQEKKREARGACRELGSFKTLIPVEGRRDSTPESGRPFAFCFEEEGFSCWFLFVCLFAFLACLLACFSDGSTPVGWLFGRPIAQLPSLSLAILWEMGHPGDDECNFMGLALCLEKGWYGKQRY